MNGGVTGGMEVVYGINSMFFIIKVDFVYVVCRMFKLLVIVIKDEFLIWRYFLSRLISDSGVVIRLY